MSLPPINVPELEKDRLEREKEKLTQTILATRAVEEEPIEQAAPNETFWDHAKRWGRILSKLTPLNRPFQKPEGDTYWQRLGSQFKDEMAALEPIVKSLDAATEPIAAALEYGVSTAVRPFGYHIPQAKERFQTASSELGDLITRKQDFWEYREKVYPQFQARDMRQQLIYGMLLDPTIIMPLVKPTKALAGPFRTTIRGMEGAHILSEAAIEANRALRYSDEAEAIFSRLGAREKFETRGAVAGGAPTPGEIEKLKGETSNIMGYVAQRARNSEEVRVNLGALEELSGRLKTIGTPEALRDRAMLELQMAGATRPVDIETFALKHAEQLQNAQRAEDVIWDFTVHQGEGVDLVERDVTILSTRFTRAKEALADYMATAPKAPTRKFDSDVFYTKRGHEIALLRKWGAEFGIKGLPKTAQEIRNIMSVSMLSEGHSIQVIQAQLGHASPEQTLNYLAAFTDFGALVDTFSKVKKVTERFPKSRAAVMEAEAARKALTAEKTGRIRSKGASPAAAQVRRAQMVLGDDVLSNIELMPEEDFFLVTSVAPGRAFDMYEEAGKLVALRNDLRAMGEDRQILRLRKKAAALRNTDAGKEQVAAINEELSDISFHIRNLSKYVGFKRTDILEALPNSGLEEAAIADIRRAVDRSDLALEPLLEEARQLGRAIGSKGKQDLIRSMLEPRAEFTTLPTKPTTIYMGERWKPWLGDRYIRKYLEARGIGPSSGYQDWKRVLGNIARTKSDKFMLGSDIEKLSGPARRKRINQLASSAWQHREMYSDYIPRVTGTKRVTRADLMEGVAPPPPPSIPEMLLKRTPDPDVMPFGSNPALLIPETGSFMETLENAFKMRRAGTLYRKLKVRPTITDADPLGTVSERARNWFAERFADVASNLSNGRAPLQERRGRIVMTAEQLRGEAIIVGAQVSDAAHLAAKQAGLTIEARSTVGHAKGNYNIKEANGFSVKQVHRLALGTEAITPPKTIMADLNFILRKVPVDQWDRYYTMTAKQKDVLLYAHALKQRALDLVLTDEVRGTGFLLEELVKGDFHEQYYPFLALAQGDTPKFSNLQPFRKEINQAQPWWFKEPLEASYAQAMKDAVVYAHPFDTLGKFVQTSKELLIEHEARLLMKTERLLVEVPRTEKTLMWSLNDATQSLIRGETPDPEDIARLEKSPQLSPLLEEVRRDAKAVEGKVSAMVRDFHRKKWAPTRGIGPAQPAIGWLHGLYIPTEYAEEISKLIDPAHGALVSIAQAAQPITAAARFLKAGLDVGAAPIFGLIPMCISSVPRLAAKGEKGFMGLAMDKGGFNAWSKATRASYEAFFHDGDVVRTYMLRPEYLTKRMEGSKYGLRYHATHEYFEALRGAPLVDTMRRFKPFDNLTKRAEMAFNAQLDIMRTELWGAMAPIAKAKGQDLYDLAASINKMSGTINPALSGTTPYMQAIQSTLLFFAPMYRRATYGMIGDLFRGGVRSEVALRSLAGMAAVGGMWGGMCKYAFGNEDALNFGSAKALTIQVGGANVGIPSAWMAIARLGGNMVMQMKDPDRPPLDTPAGWLSPQDASFARFIRSQLAPLSSASMDQFTSRSYIGKPVEGLSRLTNVATQFMPFWADPINESLTDMLADHMDIVDPTYTGEGSWIAAPFEFFGLRSFPISVYQQSKKAKRMAVLESDDPDIVKWRAAQEAAGEPLTWGKLPRLSQMHLIETFPGLQELEQKTKELDLERGDSFDADFISFRDDMESTRAQFNKTLVGIGARFERGELDSRGFREEYRTAKAVFGKGQERVYGNSKYNKVVCRIDELRDRKAKKGTAYVGDLAYDIYITTVLNADGLEDDEGNFNYDMYEMLDDIFHKQVDDPIYDYVQERRKAGREYPPAMKEFETAKATLRPYWDLHETMWGKGSQKALIVEHYISLGSNSHAKSLYRQSSPTVARALKDWEAAKDRYQARNQQVDYVLAKYYGRTPMTPQARARLGA